MKFIVSRTSDWTGKEQPCKGAKPCVIKDKKDHEIKAWEIEVNSLEELLELMEEVDEELILTDKMYNETLREIEIYDTYRE